MLKKMKRAISLAIAFIMLNTIAVYAESPATEAAGDVIRYK